MGILMAVNTCVCGTLCSSMSTPYICALLPLALAFFFFRSSLVNRTKEGPEASGEDLLCTSTCDPEEPPRWRDFDKGKLLRAKHSLILALSFFFPPFFLGVGVGWGGGGRGMLEGREGLFLSVLPDSCKLKAAHYVLAMYRSKACLTIVLFLSYSMLLWIHLTF